MLKQFDNECIEPQKIVALKFRTRTKLRERESARIKGDKFAEIDKVLDDIFQNDRLRCA